MTGIRVFAAGIACHQSVTQLLMDLGESRVSGVYSMAATSLFASHHTDEMRIACHGNACGATGDDDGAFDYGASQYDWD